MFNIGIIEVGASENKLQLDVSNSTFDYFNTEYIKPHDLDAKLDRMDAILIYTENSDSFVAKICQYIIDIRNKSKSFIWIVSKNPDERTNVIYLQLGADGNIDINCSEKEIELIIKNALNRKEEKYKKILNEKNMPTRLEDPYPMGLNENNLSFVYCDTEIQLTRIEYKLFQLLLSNPGIAFSYEEIYRHVWGQPFKNQRYRVANVVFHLREKLEQFSLNTNYIKTVRSVGYMLCE